VTQGLRVCLAPAAHARHHSCGCAASAADESSTADLASSGVKNEPECAAAAKPSASYGVGVWPTRHTTLAARQPAARCGREPNMP
jgi:hypothetical protein